MDISSLGETYVDKLASRNLIESRRPIYSLREVIKNEASASSFAYPLHRNSPFIRNEDSLDSVEDAENV